MGPIYSCCIRDEQTEQPVSICAKPRHIPRGVCGHWNRDASGQGAHELDDDDAVHGCEFVISAAGPDYWQIPPIAMKGCDVECV